MRVDEKQNTDFIYYGKTELFGIHTKQQLILKESVIQGDKTTVVNCKNVFPEYYMIYVEKFEDMIEDEIDEWIYFLKHGEIREDFKSPGILLVSKKLDYLMMNEVDKNSYNDYLAYLGQELGILDNAKAEGIVEGIEIGEAKEVGIHSIGVLFGYGDRHELEEAGADFIVDTVADIGKILCV